jgi:hypothetical protein
MTPDKKRPSARFELIFYNGKFIKVRIKSPLLTTHRLLGHQAIKYSYQFN